MTDLLSGAAAATTLSSSGSGSGSGGKNEKENDVTLWVCDKCFKYMTAGPSWELHTVCLIPNHLCGCGCGWVGCE